MSKAGLHKLWNPAILDGRTSTNLLIYIYTNQNTKYTKLKHQVNQPKHQVHQAILLQGANLRNFWHTFVKKQLKFEQSFRVGYLFFSLWKVQILTFAPGEWQISQCESPDVTLAWEDRDDPQAHRVVWWGTKWCDLAEGGSSRHIQQQVRGTGVVSDLGQWGWPRLGGVAK